MTTTKIRSERSIAVRGQFFHQNKMFVHDAQSVKQFRNGFFISLKARETDVSQQLTRAELILFQLDLSRLGVNIKCLFFKYWS